MGAHGRRRAGRAPTRERAVRRSAVLALAGAALLVAVPPAAGQAAEDALRDAAARVDAYVAAHMEASGTPGLALAVTDRDGLIHVATYGYANLDARKPVTPATRFQIGSISKSFTAIAALRLAEEGGLDLHAPVSGPMPWFRPGADRGPIAMHHLLLHTSGLPRDRDDIPTSPFRVLGVRDLTVGAAPGEHHAYSNIGYQIAGYLLETLEGRSYAEILRDRILEPVGMAESEPVITHASRARLATGYRPLFDDRPAHRSHPLIPATWFEYGDADGSVISTPADLAAYLRMLLNRGATEHGRVLWEESFEQLTQRTVPTGPNRWYGYGLIIEERDGRTLISHGGGMVGYRAFLLGDMTDGLGVVAFVNGPGNPGAVASFALDAFRAARSGAELPEPPEIPPPTRVANAADYAGHFTATDGRTLRIEAEGEQLVLVHECERVPLERRGRDAFLAPHPDFELFLLRFVREGDEVTKALHGPDWFAHPRYAGPREHELPQEWHAYVGHYRAQNPWNPGFRVIARRGELWLAHPGGAETELVQLEPGLFRVGSDERSAERLRFADVVNGSALRANLTGVDFFRTFTP